MSKRHMLSAAVNARLSAAALDVCALFEETIAEYEQELCLCKEENRRKQELLDSLLIRAASPQDQDQDQDQDQRDVCDRATSAIVQSPSLRHAQLKEEPEEPEEQGISLCIKPEEEQLQVSAPECVFTKREQLLHLQQTEIKEEMQQEPEGDPDYDDYPAPFSCSAAPTETDRQLCNNTVQITAAETSATADNQDFLGTAKRKKHQCSICYKTFARNCNLEIHIRLHSGERPHKCSFCNKTFAQMGSLKYHLVTHTGITPLSCPVCKKGFRMSSHLKDHMKTHTGEKPYSCSFCERSFSQKSHLTAHRRIHTGEKPFSCLLCDSSFVRKAELRTHMATTHE